MATAGGNASMPISHLVDFLKMKPPVQFEIDPWNNYICLLQKRDIVIEQGERGQMPSIAANSLASNPPHINFSQMAPFAQKQYQNVCLPPSRQQSPKFILISLNPIKFFVKMLSNNLSAAGLFPSSHCRPRLNSGSSRSSSAFSSQNFTTQSDTEAEEEKKFEKRRQQRRQMATAMTPSRLMWPGGGRKEFVTPMMFAASCSTPKSSLELLDETSIYFRPLSNHKLMGFGQNGDAAVGRESRKQRAMEQQQRKLINDLARQNRRHRTLEANRRGSKTSQIIRKRHNGDGRIFGGDFGPSLHRRHHHHRSNPLMAFLEEDGEGRCSSPILLDFLDAIPTDGNELEEHRDKGGGNFGTEKVFIPANSSDQFESNYAIPRKNPIGLMQNCRQHCYTNLSPFLRIIQKPAKRSSMVISPHDENTGEPKSNSDSGMEERNTLEEEWEKQTQFVNISDGEETKLYENLPPPPTIHQQMEAPKPPTRRPPANPPQQPYFGTMGNQPQSMTSHHQFMVEDVPALYGRLATAAFIQARNVEGGGTTAPKVQMMSSIEKARRIRLAQRELAELVGIRLAKGVELSGTALDSDENFRRKSIEFGTQLAQKLRQTEAHSRKEFNWQIKKLQKILHELRRRTGEEDERRRRSGGEGGGTLHKLFKRVFNWK